MRFCSERKLQDKEEETYTMCKQNPNLKNWGPGSAQKDAKICGLEEICISNQ